MEIVTLEAVANGDRSLLGRKWQMEIVSLEAEWQMDIVTGTVTVTVI